MSSDDQEADATNNMIFDDDDADAQLLGVPPPQVRDDQDPQLQPHAQEDATDEHEQPPLPDRGSDKDDDTDASGSDKEDDDAAAAAAVEAVGAGDELLSPEQAAAAEADRQRRKAEKRARKEVKRAAKEEKKRLKKEAKKAEEEAKRTAKRRDRGGGDGTERGAGPASSSYLQQTEIETTLVSESKRMKKALQALVASKQAKSVDELTEMATSLVSFKTDDSYVRSLLSDLSSVAVTAKQLNESGLGLAVGQFLDPSLTEASSETRMLANAILQFWYHACLSQEERDQLNTPAVSQMQRENNSEREHRQVVTEVEMAPEVSPDAVFTAVEEGDNFQ